MVLVLFVLPCILVIGEKLIERTSFVMKGIKVDLSEYEDFGTMRVKGHMHGWVEGIIEGDVDAVVYGRVHAAVVANNLSIEMQEHDPQAAEKAKQAYADELNAQNEDELANQEGGTNDEV